MRWKIILAGLVLSLAAGGGVFAYHKSRTRNDARGNKDKAFVSAQRGETEKAVNLMRSYILTFRDDVQAMRDLAQLLEKTAKLPGDQMHVLHALEQALVVKPDDAETRQFAVRKALELRRFGVAQAHLEYLPRDAEVERQLGECDEGLGKFESAAAHYAAAVKQDAKHVEAYIRHAHLLRTRLDKLDEGDGLMAQLRRAQPDSTPALSACARYYRESGRPELAQADVERLLQLAGDQAEVRFLAAQHEIALNHLQAAEEHLRIAVDKNPDHLQSIKLLAEMGKRKPREADQNFRALALKTLRLLEDNPRKTADVLDLLIDVEELAEARKILAGPKTDWLPSYLREFLEARIAIGEEDFVRGRELLERCRSQLAPVQSLARTAHLLLGLCHRKLGNPDQAAKACRTAIDLAPAWTPAHLELAAANIERGQFDEAQTIYRRLMPQVPEVRLTIARLLLAQTMQQIPQVRHWKPIEDLLAEAPPGLRQSVEWRMVRNDVLLAQGKDKLAREELQAAIQGDGKQISYRLALAGLAVRQKDLPTASRILATARQDLGDRVELRLAEGNLAVHKPPAEAAMVLNALASGVERFSRSEQIRLYSGLYRLGATVDPSLARQIGEKLAELQPNRIDLRFGLLRLALAANDEPAAKKLIAQMRRIEGETGPFWKCAEAAVLLQFSKSGDDSWLVDARNRATDAARARPDWGLPIMLLGELDERQGNAESALQRFRSAIELGEISPMLIRRTVQLLQARRQFEDAQDLLRKLGGRLNLDADLARLALPALVGRESPEQILDKAKKLAPESSTDYREHLWLGHLLASLNRTMEAEQAYRRALERNSKAGEAWVGLVFFLAGQRQIDKARSALTEAEKSLAGQESASALALCHEVLGMPADAERRLKEALAQKPGDADLQRGLAGFYLRGGQPEKARPMLEALSDGTSSEAGWARRQRAMLLIHTGSPARLREAVPLIEKNLHSASATAEDQRAHAIILALQPAQRDDAIAALEASFRAMPATGDEQVLLARLYEAKTNWPAARERLQAIASGSPLPHHLEYFIRRLLHHDDVAAAFQWLERLEKLDPDSMRTVFTRARVLVAMNRANEARDLLRKFVLATPHLEAIIQAGRLLEELDLHDAAEQAFRRYALRARPTMGVNADLPLARYLGSRGKVAEALALIEAAGVNAQPESVLAVVSALVRTPKLDTASANRLNAWVQAVGTKNADSPACTLAQAEMCEHAEQFDEAERRYDQALAKAPQHIGALNNSAVLLALRGQSEQALLRVNQAIDLVGPAPALLDTRGLAHLAAGKFAEAIADLNEAIAQDDSAVRRYHLALAHKAAGNTPAFADHLQRAKDLKLDEQVLHPLERASFRQSVLAGR